ncbi:hypothetical protein [Marinilabilia sp.]
MIVFKHIQRLEKINKLISENRTGTPDEFAQRIGVRRRQLFNYLDELRSYGVDICYCRQTRSYLFENNKHLKINFECKVIDFREQKGTSAGWKIKCFSNTLMSVNLH